MTKEFTIMYALDGELLESIDEVEKDCDVILVSNDKFNFKGLHSTKDEFNSKDLRVDNCITTKKRYFEVNKNWTNN